MKELSVSLNTQSLVLSFAAHPRSVLYPEHRLPVITTLDERLAAIEECGIDAVLLINFTKETAAMSASEFVERFIIERFGASHMVIGYDHAFGRNREGNIDFLLSLGARCGFGVTQVKPYLCDGHPVSSSRIRDEIEDGDVSDAARYLGRSYRLSGAVVEGFKRGRVIGFPTANIQPADPGKVIPADGVYATLVHLPDGSVYHSVTSIGSNPTFGGVPRTIETHLLDYNSDLYGRTLTVDFAARIRGEVRFASVQELTEAIRLDCEESRRILPPL
jgi:riboflavin kinase/FMN adenylyltransferase